MDKPAEKSGPTNQAPHHILFAIHGHGQVLAKDGSVIMAGTHAELVAGLKARGVDWTTLERIGATPKAAAGKPAHQVRARTTEPWTAEVNRNGVALTPAKVTIVDLPMLRLIGPDGQRPYVPIDLNRVDSGRLSDQEGQALRDLMDGLTAAEMAKPGNGGGRRVGAGEAVRWLLRRLAAASPEARQPDKTSA